LSLRSTPERRAGGRRAAAIAALFGALGLLALFALPAIAELAQKGPLRVSVSGKIAPKSLPRNGGAPVAVSFGGQIGTTQPEGPPQLRRITVEINRHGHLSGQGLPLCRERQIQPGTTEHALEACAPSLVGEGLFAANVKFPTQSPFPSQGKILAFNGRFDGKPAILAHIYGKKPLPISYVLPFVIHHREGTFGTLLEAFLPRATGNWGFVTGVEMTLQRRFAFQGTRRSYLTASCPAPAGFRSAFFPLARTSFSFAGDVTLTSLLTRRCTVSR
jgi:hypothetical protein